MQTKEKGPRSNPKTCRICVGFEPEPSADEVFLGYCATCVDPDRPGEFLRIPADAERTICADCDGFHRYHKSGPSRHQQRANILYLRQLEIDRERVVRQERTDRVVSRGTVVLVLLTVSLVFLTVVLALMTAPVTLDAYEKVSLKWPVHHGGRP